MHTNGNLEVMEEWPIWQNCGAVTSAPDGDGWFPNAPSFST